jgi:hypothetical protein
LPSPVSCPAGKIKKQTYGLLAFKSGMQKQAMPGSVFQNNRISDAWYSLQ